MRLMQALAITIPSWIFLYFLLNENVLWTSETTDLLLVMVIVIGTLCASVIAFFRCDLRITLNRSKGDVLPDEKSTRANIAFLLTGLALGLFPTLMWAYRLVGENQNIREVAEGVAVIAARDDLEPGDVLTWDKLILKPILRDNITNYHFYYSELDLVLGAKVVSHIPSGISLLSVQLEGLKEPPKPKTNQVPMRMQDVGI